MFVGYWAQRLWWYAFGVQEQVTFCCFEFGVRISVSKLNSVLPVSLPCDILWKLCRSKARLAIGDISGALEDAEEAIRISPKFTQVFDLLGTSKFPRYHFACIFISCLAIHVMISISLGISLKSTNYDVYLCFHCLILNYELAGCLVPVANVCCKLV